MDNFTTVTMVRTTLTDETSTANTSEGEEHIGATEVEEVGGVSDGDYDDTTVQPHITTKPTFTTQKTATEKEETQTENEETTASESTEEGNEETTSGDESTKPSEATEKPENKEPTDAPYYTTLGFDEQTDANVANLTNFDHKLYDQTSTGALVAAMCFGILFLFAVMVLLGKRAYESYQRRHYSKMDYLINGMYN
uniref:Uncharacterized protein C11orf24-like isoform X2 n=1 Tax=Saccoglossus kowalevskii TaxID=10224 RepID=A0ABM0MFV8_SACKO|nr:PREDICTED: uncharacterized protein C11orf24-like isoform X2 [Saccoglossus kowalevskii]